MTKRTIRVLGDDIEVDEDRERPRPFHSPSEALQTHYRLLDWIDTPHGLDITENVILRRHKENMAQDSDGNEVPYNDYGVVEGYRSMLWDACNFNNTMYVSAHMCDQLQALIPSFEDEPLWLTDLPDEKGLVLFEAAIRSVMSGNTLDVDPGDDPLDYWIKGFAYRWVDSNIAEIERNNVHIRIHIESKQDDVDPATERRIAAFKTHGGILVWPLFDAGEFFVSKGQWEANGRPPLLPMPFCAQPFGPKVDLSDDGTDIYQIRQIVVTLFRLVWQHILVEETTFPKPERKRIERIARKHHRFPLDGEDIKIRHLRRLEGDDEPSPRDTPERQGHTMTYRIIVKGHPREQWYRSLGPARKADGTWNEASHRKIWINAHIRGPEHSPLVLKHSLDVVVR